MGWLVEWQVRSDNAGEAAIGKTADGPENDRVSRIRADA